MKAENIRNSIILLLLAVLINLGLVNQSLAQEESLSYELFVPKGLNPKKPVPLVVLCHGCTQNAEMVLEVSGFHELAEREGFVVVAPEQSVAFNKTRCFNWFLARGQKRESGELHEILRIVDEVIRSGGDQYKIDKSRVYSAGIAAGGITASGLVAAFPNRFAGVGVHSALPWGAMRIEGEGSNEGLKPSYREMLRTMLQIPNVLMTSNPTPVVESLDFYPRDFSGSVVIVHGTADPIHHPNNFSRILRSFFGEAEPIKEEFVNEGKSGYKKLTFSGKGGIEHTAIMVEGLGNRWSGGLAIPGDPAAGAIPSHGPLGDPKTVNATELMWQTWQAAYKIKNRPKKTKNYPRYRCSKVFAL